MYPTMNGENQPLVTDELVEVQDFTKTNIHSRGIFQIYPKLMKKYRKMTTCEQLDLETLGF